MTLVVNHPQAGEWVRERIPKVARWLDGFKSIAEVRDGQIAGAVVYDGFTPYDCNVHIAIKDKRCVNRRTIRAVFDYPFEQLKLYRVTALVGSRNEKSLAFVSALGFKVEGTKHRALGIDNGVIEDEVIFGMVREECTWL